MGSFTNQCQINHLSLIMIFVLTSQFQVLAKVCLQLKGGLWTLTASKQGFSSDLGPVVCGVAVCYQYCEDCYRPITAIR